MNLRLALSLAMASLWYRRRVLALVTLTLTLSITLLLGVQYLRTEVKQSFTSTIRPDRGRSQRSAEPAAVHGLSHR